MVASQVVVGQVDSLNRKEVVGEVNQVAGVVNNKIGAIGKAMVNRATTRIIIAVNKATVMAIGVVGTNSITISIGASNNHRRVDNRPLPVANL